MKFGYVMIGVGLLLVAGGVTTYYLSPSMFSPTDPSTRVAPPEKSPPRKSNKGSNSPSSTAQKVARAKNPLLQKKRSQTIKKRHLPQQKGKSFLHHAVLLNGGSDPQNNFFSHHLYIRMMHELLQRRGLSRQAITVFSTDGEDKRPDLMVGDRPPWLWLFEGLPAEQLFLQSRLINTTLAGERLHPAKRRVIRRWFRQLARRWRRQKRRRLFLFVTDHGTKGRGPLGNKIELWRENVSVGQLRHILRPLGRQTRVVTVMSQCYSGGFANLLYRGPNRVHGNRCGFFSTLAGRESYGCFPDTARENRVGHAYRFIRAMGQAKTFEEAHRRVMLSDRSPDVPLATSDIYLEDRLQRYARLRRRALTPLVNRLLQRVWKGKDKALQKDIKLLRRVQKRFKLPKHRRLSAVHKEIRRTRRLRKKLEHLEKIWHEVLSSLRQWTLARFYQETPRVYSSVQRELQRPQIDALTQRIGKELRQTYLSYLKQNKMLRQRIQRVRQRAEVVHRRVYQLEVREAALLRISMLMYRLAGRLFLQQKGRARERASLRKLLACEATPISSHPFAGELRAEGPASSSKKVASLYRAVTLSDRQLLPSWLGIAFQPAPPSPNTDRVRQQASGAVQIMEVEPGGPAHKSGLQPGDIILALGGKFLRFSDEIRERVMLSSSHKPTYFLIQRQGTYRTLPVQLQPMGGPLLASASPRTPHAKKPRRHLSPREEFSSRKPAWRRRVRPRQKSIATLQTPGGKKLDVPGQDKATLLFFWATWCEGCKNLVPLLRHLQRRFRHKKFRIIAVTTDEASLVRNFQRRWGRRFPFVVGLDLQSSLSQKYRVHTLPTLILLSPKKDKPLLRITPTGSFDALRYRLLRTIKRALRR